MDELEWTCKEINSLFPGRSDQIFAETFKDVFFLMKMLEL